MFNNIEYSNKRTECPVCHKRHALASIISIDGQNVQNEGFYYCHACGARSFPNTTHCSNFKSRYLVDQKSTPNIKKPDYELLQKAYDYSIANTTQSGLFKHLARFVETEALKQHFNQNSVGADTDGNCIFWTLEASGRPIKPKVIPYNPWTGKRIKNNYNSAGASVNIEGRKFYFTIRNGYISHRLFGQEKLKWQVSYSIKNHSNLEYAEAPVILVESEKSALIAQIEFPQYIWIATSGVNGLTNERAKSLIAETGNRKILICFDNDCAGTEGSQKVLNKIEAFDGFAEILQFNDVFPDAPKGNDFADIILSDYDNELIEMRMLYNDITNAEAKQR